MALHELSTNAVKYGSLSVPAGKVVIAWHVATEPSGRRFRMSWREDGGPPVSAPTKTGFAPALEDQLSIHSVSVRPSDGRMTDTDAKSIGEMRVCIGQAMDPTLLGGSSRPSLY